MDQAYAHFEKSLPGGVDIAKAKESLLNQKIETPSWGYADSGTRFQVFHQPGAARTVFEKLDDAAMVHQMTGITPSVALHIPWDEVDDYERVVDYAAELDLTIGAINPNLFQEPEYKLGSLCHPDKVVRRKALDHILECIEIMNITGSKVLSLWLADGTNYPGQDDFRARKKRLEDTLRIVCDALADDQRLLIEYKFFEPAFYHTDLADWGMATLLATKLGPKAQTLVDLGHHPLGTNIEQIVAYLIDEGKLGGFHFNSKKYADDDLTTGSTNPYELFLIYNELVAGAEDLQEDLNVAYMIDQSHNVKPKVAAMIQSVESIQAAYAKALLVDRQALREAQREGDIIGAETILRAAYDRDVTPLLVNVREELQVPIAPLEAYRQSGYQEKIARERG
ncbi:MAG: L-rhamnose isomerase [Firmicutes bacterium]|jgi:L-rhamnose isomerase/sugar isomerase|nr:L-rhamnose isomerase [Bacillota bacterium]